MADDCSELKDGHEVKETGGGRFSGPSKHLIN